MGPTASLWTLFGSSFLAATLLPGGSEAVLFAVLRIHPELFWPALAAATLGNTLGGMSSYLIGRLIPQRRELKRGPAVWRAGFAVLLGSAARRFALRRSGLVAVESLDLERVHGCGEVRAVRRDCVCGPPCCRGRSGRVMTMRLGASLNIAEAATRQRGGSFVRSPEQKLNPTAP